MTLLYSLELTGTALFAISGALVAGDRSNHDWFGVTFIGFITSIGGGTLRDLLLGDYPLCWIRDTMYLYSILAGIILAKLFYGRLLHYRNRLFLIETFAVAFFTILGCEKALSLGVDPVIASIMGMFSAVMGGVIRDVLTNEIPVLFRPEIYATACLAGAFLFIGMMKAGVDKQTSSLLSMGVIAAIRIFAVRYKVSLPEFRGK